MRTNKFTENDLLKLQKRGMKILDPIMEQKVKKALPAPRRKRQANYFQGKEDQFQIILMGELKSMYENKMIIHVPNGGFRTAYEASMLKAMGVMPGVPDVLIFDDKIFLELKVFPNKPTDEQLAVMEKLKSIGWRGDVFYSIDDAIDFTQKLINQ